MTRSDVARRLEFDITGTSPYEHCEDTLNFTAAVAHCKSKGAVLYNPRSREEYLYGCWAFIDLKNCKPPKHNSWIGIVKRGEEWVYASDNSPVVLNPDGISIEDMSGLYIVQSDIIHQQSSDSGDKRGCAWQAVSAPGQNRFICVKGYKEDRTPMTTTATTNVTTPATEPEPHWFTRYFSNTCFIVLVVLAVTWLGSLIYIMCFCVLCSQTHYSVLTWFEGSSYFSQDKPLENGSDVQEPTGLGEEDAGTGQSDQEKMQSFELKSTELEDGKSVKSNETEQTTTNKSALSYLGFS